MIRIGIVDDEERAVKRLRIIVEKYMTEREEEYEIQEYLSGKKMLKGAKELALVFLDVDMPDMDGLETGRRLNRINPDCTIIMATVHKESFKEGFKISAFRYVTKPFEEEEIEEALGSYLEKRIGIKEIEVFRDRIAFRVHERNICYLKAYDGYTMIFVKKKEYRSETTLKEYEELLDGRIFFRISRSYIVNLLKIDEYKDGKVFLGGEKFSVARTNRTQFKMWLIKADAEYGLGIKIC